MIEKYTNTDRVPESIWNKLNPAWWLIGPDGWTVPDINNDAPYLPDVKNKALRIFYWFFCRNPGMNFVGFVLGVEDKNYTAYGSSPINVATLRDVTPPRTGWKWSVILPPFSLGALVIALATLALGFLWWPVWIVTVFAGLKVAGPLPFVSYWGGKIESYLGWRPASGGYGFKFIIRANG